MEKFINVDTDVLIIGAGPSGAVAAKLLRQKGFQVLVLERATFPRFSIGESMLPQTMEILAEADMLEDIEKAGFQYKDGAVFCISNKCSAFDFNEQFYTGHKTAFQVERDTFDKLLADNAASAGADIRYQEEILSVDFSEKSPVAQVRNVTTGKVHSYRSRFVFDASGFGRVLPRLLNLEVPSDFPSRQSLFTHVQDNISDSGYDRNKITIAVHPDDAEIWYWLIPFSNGRSSIGVVAKDSFLAKFQGSEKDILKQLINESPEFSNLLSDATYPMQARKISGYSANVKQLWGSKYCLLGNAGEFLDPVFSSGVTIAVKSAALAVNCVVRELKGEPVDWQRDYAKILQSGVDTFRVYVEAWYNGDFQNIIFYPNPAEKVKRMLCSILSGYVWDDNNPYVTQNRRRLNVLAELAQGTLTG